MRRSVLITGTSSGIGHAAALELARSGFLVLAGVRRPQDAARLAEELGDDVVPVLLDVTSESSIASAAAEVSKRLGDAGLHGLVNNAGIGVAGPVEYLQLDALRREFEVNVFGLVAVTQAFLPLIRRARGRIVNIGSVGSHITMPFGGALCGSKYAVRSLNDAMRLELHAFGIHVAMVEPGSIHTPAVEKTLGDVEGAIRRLPPEGAVRYGSMLREFNQRAYRREHEGSPPEVVARAIHHALTDRRPRSRYPAGKDARMLTTIPRVLPDRVLDRLRYRLFGLPSRFGEQEASSP